MTRTDTGMPAGITAQAAKNAPKPDSLMESIIHGDSEFMRRATDEALAYLQWLNRFAEAQMADAETSDR